MSGLAALAAALPECAIACVLIAVEDSTCSITNQTCVCHDETFNTHATACVAANCTVREGLFTKNLTSTSCGIAPRVDHSYVPVLITFVALSAVSVLIRVIARLQARVPVWWDDFIITLSFVRWLLAPEVFRQETYRLKSHGLGTDIWAIPFDDITLIFKALYTLFVVYVTSRDLVRLSILLFYHRIFGHIALARRLIQFSFVLIILCCIAFDFAIIFGCRPLDYFWTSWDGQNEGHCISTNGIFWAGAFVVIAIDIWIMLLPLPFVLRLNLSLRKRILSATMFTFGIFVVIVSFYRLTTINHFTLSQNPTGDFVDVGIWSGLELYVGIICACLPNFHSFLKPVYAWLGLSSSSRATPSYPTSGGSGSSSGRPHRPDGARSGSEAMICATTTVDVKEHRLEDQMHLSSPGWDDMTRSMEEIELGTRRKGATSGSAWS
ncbi:hypothetical protein AAE478_006024 [Parahypoxylon ruwenzoriense]